MGVPKFFRWMSERYPAISQLIAESRIPEFDCLYLDMNGIIHNCTHKDSDSPSFRMTEDKMFIAIFNYIEHLFSKIKPKQLFFMAIDGVAPRAKMNQQRARRFRTALDAEKAREKAIAEGAEMPTESPFDSNCITPGTEFMARLTQQLKYFISKKVTEDADWQNVEVILSGHEVPGEGEHKIMEYIRQAKSQPNYDPNVRHCLYGLDADLIMLGLLSHDPHFCLLREEVTFGRQSKVKSKELEHQNFYLMHLCIVREYLELEFQELAIEGAMSFPYDMERIIDDFILMCFFVGNDFLPNLPHLHINEGALALMFEAYKKILPRAGGYINNEGEINLPRLGMLLDELSGVEHRFFESEHEDANWLRSKQKENEEEEAQPKQTKNGHPIISTSQKRIFNNVKKWVNSNSSGFANRPPLNLGSTLPARDREFVKTLAKELHVDWRTVDDDTGNRHMQLVSPPPLEDGADEDDEDEEAQTALFRVLKRYDKAQVTDMTADDAKKKMQEKYDQKFYQWRDEYYRSKLDWGLDDQDELRKLSENYVQGLQWVLYYYYRGVASWPWFFRYHYSPMISDVKKGFNADMNFELGQPFRPFQQLMGVLPDRSKQIVPTPYHDLMTNPQSPIYDFYPRDFELDMNGKKMEWEAVIKIPFIDEKRLLAAMATKEDQLSDDERRRNEFGVTLKYTYASDTDFTYPSSMPGIFNDIPACRCVENIYELPTMDGLEYHVGLVQGVKLGVESLAGFPTLKVLPHVGQLAHHGVSVFQQDSRNQSMIVTLLGAETLTSIENAKQKLGQVVHVGFPFLQEAKVVKVSDELFDYVLPAHPSPQAIQIHHSDAAINDFAKMADRLEKIYSKRLGMIVGTIDSIVHVEMLKGLKKTEKGDLVKEYGPIAGVETQYATQTIVDSVISEDERFLERDALPIEEELPLKSNGFFLGLKEGCYGRPLEIAAHRPNDKVDVWLATARGRDESWGKTMVESLQQNTPYFPAYRVASQLQMNPLALSKLTSSFNVISSSLRLNLGLNLKFEAKQQKVLGYSRKGQSGWEYSVKAVTLISQYMINFPDFIAGIQRNPKGDGFQDTDFYPKEIAADKMKEIGQWLKTVETKEFERVPLHAEQLDSDGVHQVQQGADYVFENSPPPKTQKLEGAPRHSILKPADAAQRLNAQHFAVGDRCVYVADKGKVPIGMTGTVVGITASARTTFLDVLFDATFMSGTTLNERCSPFRGASVECNTLLNLTDQQVFADTRPKKPTEPRGYYAVNGFDAGAGVAGQMVPAAAPAPLRGSFRGAVAGPHPRGGAAGRSATNGINGHANGHHAPLAHRPARGNQQRGGLGYSSTLRVMRGGPGQYVNRQGFNPVDNSDPMAGVVDRKVQPQNYTNVPPPASLETAGRGRGFRGRGRGRGRGAR
ncbi:MAG: hypothetical protein Q9159_002816 [Coniocarpon cinnabarinum]